MFGQQKINFQFNEQNSVDICSNICKLQCRKKAHSLLKTTCNFPKFAYKNLNFEGNYITSCRECFKIHIKGNQFSILIISFVGTCTIDQDFEEISLPLFLSLSHIKYLYSISVNKSYIYVLFYLRFSVLPCTFKHEKKEPLAYFITNIITTLFANKNYFVTQNSNLRQSSVVPNQANFHQSSFVPN